MKRGRDEYVPTKIKKTWHRFSLIYYDERRYKNNNFVISVNHNRSASISVKIFFLQVLNHFIIKMFPVYPGDTVNFF